VALDKKKIHLELPLRALGEHEVELHLHADVKPKLKVVIESTSPAEIPAAAAKPAGKPTDEGRPGRDREDRPQRRPKAAPAGDKPAAKEAKPRTEKKA
jgi:hypothetical protein